ncbi:MAG: hypothetical protein WDW36_005671 [Sanguina aurantia]
MAAAVWTHCMTHLGQVGRPRTSSLAVLVQLFPLLLSGEGRMLEDLGQEGSHGFWEVLRACLAGSDDLDRKRAVYLLQQLLTHQAQPQLNAWTTFLALHGALDEFAFNMVLPVWTHQIDTLQPPLSAYASGVASTGSAAQERTNQKLRPKRHPLPVKETTTATATAATTPATTAHERSAAADDSSAETATAPAAAAAASEAAPAPPALAMPWRCVVWQRALQHANPYVQRLGLRSFLQRDWETPPPAPLRCTPPSRVGPRLHRRLMVPVRRLMTTGPPGCLKGGRGAGAFPVAGRPGMGGVADDFVRSVLLPAAVTPFQYHLVDGVSDGYDVQAGLTAWLAGWLAAAPDNATRRQALAAWLALSSSSTLCREGQTRLASVLADVAGSLPQGMRAGLDGDLEREWSSAVLHSLKRQLASLHRVQGLQPRLRLAAAVLRTAASLLPLLPPPSTPTTTSSVGGSSVPKLGGQQQQQHSGLTEEDNNAAAGLPGVTLLLLELPFAALSEGTELHAILR